MKIRYSLLDDGETLLVACVSILPVSSLTAPLSRAVTVMAIGYANGPADGLVLPARGCGLLSKSLDTVRCRPVLIPRFSAGLVDCNLRFVYGVTNFGSP